MLGLDCAATRSGILICKGRLDAVNRLSPQQDPGRLLRLTPQAGSRMQTRGKRKGSADRA